ncbi:MAG: 2-hydroxyacid dehydrogenase [Aequoribacter sp.]|uniref:2-hydroxyacid dehydrogenase n=1 Tax=Aequoribacter sp. TaxID=2847771 RepID=UPI003C63D97D
MKPTILVSDIIQGHMLAPFEQLGQCVPIADSNDITDASVVISTAFDNLDADAIARLPVSVRLISNLGAGVDKIDLEAARRKGIAVTNTPIVADDTADLAFALLLATLRKTSYSEYFLRQNDWATAASIMGVTPRGKTLGIIGAGAIGSAMARRAQAFGLKLCYHGPNQKPGLEQELDIQFEPTLEGLLAKSDVISLHCPLTENTQHCINAVTLAAMKPGAFIINTGRGPLINEQDLVDALNSGHLAGAGLDVFEYEPQVHPELLNNPHVTLTAHIGGATPECRTAIVKQAIDNAAQYLTTGALNNRVI